MSENKTPSIRRKREKMTDTKLLLTITICIFIVMYVAAMIFLGGGFLRAQKVFDLLNENCALLIVSLGLSMVMICGSIDISVGGMVAMISMACVVHLNNGGSIVTAILIALGIGAGFGLVQGYLVAYLNIQPFIVSLAGMFFARGMTTIISVQPQSVSHEGFKELMKTKLEIPLLGYTAKNGNLIPAKVELSVIIATVLVILVFLMLQKTRLGRNFYAVGGNQQSALMLGVNVRRTKFLAHLFCSILAGIAGFCYLMHTGAGNASNAQGMEMNAIASSIIGGTLLTGGVGNIIGTFFGVLTLTTIKSIVVSSGLKEPYWQSITSGAMLALFILLQSVVLNNRGKKTKGISRLRLRKE